MYILRCNFLFYIHLNHELSCQHWHTDNRIITTLVINITMSFCPETQDLVKYHRADAQGLVLSLGPLDRNAPKTDIEDAIRTIPEFCGRVTVCWQGVVPQRRPRRQEQRQNPGWCHILCTNMEVKDCVLGVLHNQQLIGSSRQTMTVARAKKPIV
ncbi:hypothetical protein F5Y08DRAFT_322617 [Xylaria arbuscula]|nr:hypothetical protein F5Y08DRAFT_322617 [Xylaria arbuscula]